MCGIVGYVGYKDAVNVLLKGLGRLEYRGYDSAGVAVLDEAGVLRIVKKAGKLSALQSEIEHLPKLTGKLGIGHTRWATHGKPSDENAHPHHDEAGRLALIHNGIIENYAELKEELLAAGKVFLSDTDSEVVAHLLSDAFEQLQDLTAAFRRVVKRLTGAFTLIAIHQDQPGIMVGARRNSPLVVGLGEGENFFASDIAAFADYTAKVVTVEQDQIVTLSKDSLQITDFAGNPAEYTVNMIDWKPGAADKSGWSSFMLKEIFEEPQAVAATLRDRTQDDRVLLPELDHMRDQLKEIDRIVLIGCGTAAYAALTASYSIEAWTGLPVAVELSHEFRYREPIISPRTLVVSVSQSGETMDTLMAVKHVNEQGGKTISVCNVKGSSIPRESAGAVYTDAGPEVAVASTKSFICQVVAMYLLALYLGELRGFQANFPIPKAINELKLLPGKLTQVLENHHEVQQLAHWMSDSRSVLFLGRQVGYPIAMEAALKLKELAYIHAEGFAAGELKHGPIALIEAGQPVFVIVPSPIGSPVLHAKVISNIQEIRARGARVIAIAEVGDAAVLPYADQVLTIPLARYSFEPLLAVVPLQMFALELASAKGLDVDQPRNLAKSVTVE